MKKNKKVIIILLICLTITVTVFARFILEAKSDESANVALFVFEDTVNTLSLKLSDENISPGKEYLYTFDITNFKNNKRAGVSIEYTIKIDSSLNLPLKYEILKNDVTLTLNDNQTESQTLVSDKNQTDHYTLKITFLDVEENYRYANMLEYVDITIDAKQKM